MRCVHCGAESTQNDVIASLLDAKERYISDYIRNGELRRMIGEWEDEARRRESFVSRGLQRGDSAW